MIVYMQHKDHGTHIAYTEDEIEQCKKNGWVVKSQECDEDRPEPKKVLHLPKRKRREEV